MRRLWVSLSTNFDVPGSSTNILAPSHFSPLHCWVSCIGGVNKSTLGRCKTDATNLNHFTSPLPRTKFCMVDLGEPIFPPFSSQSTVFEAFSLLWSFSLLCLVIMIYRRIDTAIKSKDVKFLRSHWRSDAVVFKSYCHRFIIYRWKQKLQIFEVFNSSDRFKIDVSRRIITATKNALLKYQRRHSYAFLNELALYFKEKWEIHVHKFTVFQFLRRKQITHKKEKLMKLRSQLLCIEWQVKMQNVIVNNWFFMTNLFLKLNQSDVV